LQVNENYKEGAIRGLEEELNLKLKEDDLILVEKEHEILTKNEEKNINDFELSQLYFYKGIIIFF
jgi:hypothetical protein